METRSVTVVLSALAQESRLIIYRTLIQAGPSGMSAGKISDVTGIAPSSLSFHLKELYHADLVSYRNESRFVIYSANFNVMNEVIQYLTESCCGGSPCFSSESPFQLEEKTL